MAYTAYLTVDGEKFRVHQLSYSMYQNTDETGRPSSEVFGGQLHLEVESKQDNNLFWDWMISKSEKKDGEIVIEDPKTSGGEFKKIAFTQAYLTNYTETLASTSNEPMMENLVLCADSVEVNSSKFENPWEHF